MPRDVQAAAQYYAERGWVPVPVKARGKTPIGDEWQKRTLADVKPEEFTGNIGIVLGAPSGNLADIDLDCPEAIIAARYLLPPTRAVFGRQSKPGSHGVYKTDKEPKTLQHRDIRDGTKPGTMLVELRGTGGQTVVPPSIHESGEAIAWVKEPFEPATVELAELQRCTAEVAAAALLARHHPGDGSRHEFALVLAGMLCHGNYPRERAALLVEAVSAAAGDRDHSDRRKCVDDTYNRKDGHNTTGGPTLAKLMGPGVGERVTEQVRQWLKLKAIPADSVEETTESWEEPVPLGVSLAPVPVFPLELLPAAVRAWISDIADRMQCPIEFPAAACLVSLGSIIGRRCAIRPKRKDDWTVVPNMFGAVVSPPGTLKSPPVHEAQRPLYALEADAREAFELATKAYEFERVVVEQRKKVLADNIRKSLKSGGNPREYEAEMDNIPEPPTRARYIINDATVEKLGEILNENPNGVLVNRDELAGLLRSMAKEGHECDRAFYLEAWNGDKPFQFDRIGRGTTFIASTCLSIFGTIQPGPLLEHIRASIRENNESDGLIQRFQVLVWPDVSREWRNVDRWPDSGAKAAAREVYRRLAGVRLKAEDGEIPFLRFSDEAQAFFDEWRTKLELRLRASTDHAVIEAHLSKYRSFHPSLALISHLADCAERDILAEPPPVTLEAALRAAALCEVFEAHARRVYCAALASGEEAAGLLLKKLQGGQLAEAFTARDIYRKKWPGLTDHETVNDALLMLEEFGWLRQKVEQTGGRPRVSWAVNPLGKRVST